MEKIGLSISDIAHELGIKERSVSENIRRELPNVVNLINNHHQAWIEKRLAQVFESNECIQLIDDKREKIGCLMMYSDYNYFELEHRNTPGIGESFQCYLKKVPVRNFKVLQKEKDSIEGLLRELNGIVN